MLTPGVRTQPVIAPCLWSDFPFTVNWTSLGVLDLTSRFADDTISVRSSEVGQIHTRGSVVEIFAQKLCNLD